MKMSAEKSSAVVAAVVVVVVVGHNMLAGAEGDEQLGRPFGRLDRR